MTQHARRRMLVAGAAAVLASPLARSQQGFPAKPIRLVIGYPAGGPLDVLSRLVADEMGHELGQPVVVENRIGASGQIATDFVARAPADGYTLLSAASTFIVNPLLMEKVASNPLRDFVAVAQTAVLPTIVITAPNSGLNSVQDIIAKAKKDPGGVTYGSPGNGGPAHLAGALLATRTGTQQTHVPMKGAAIVMNEIIAGRIDYTFYTMTGLREFVNAGRVKALAITAPRREASFPEVPTMAEVGFPGFEDVGAWFGVVAPAGTPAPVVARLNQAIDKALARPATRQKITAMGIVPVGGPAENFKSFLARDLARWSALIKAAGIKAE